MRPALIALLLIATVALAACRSDDDGAESAARAAGPAPVFLEGGREDFEKWVAQKRGTPVVVNKWASWCGPCRLEFPFFGDQARKRRGEVAFLGVNSNDSRGEAEDFVRENPVPFPHFEDPNLEIAAAFDAVQAFPATAYYDSQGELAYVHQGQYPSERELADDIDRYAR